MPKGFTVSFAERLNMKSSVTVGWSERKEDELKKMEHVYSGSWRLSYDHQKTKNKIAFRPFT